MVLACCKPECRPNKDEVADEACPSFCLVVGVSVFEFKATASDAEVVPESPGECDDEAHEHPENRKCGFADERRYNHGEAEPEFKLRIDKRKEVVHEVQVQCREELVLRYECCKLVRVLDFENRGEDEHAANAYATKRFERARGKVFLNLECGGDQGASECNGANTNVDVVAVSLRPNIQKPLVVGECEECFGKADFCNTDCYKERGECEENACDNRILEVWFFKTCNHSRSLQDVCRFFENFLGANPIDGFGVIDSNVVYDGKSDAECGNAEQDNPI